jgi:hypothetical protein
MPRLPQIMAISKHLRDGRIITRTAVQHVPDTNKGIIKAARSVRGRI